MSKRSSTGQANTLLNYFQSPKGSKTSKNAKTSESRNPADSKEENMTTNEENEEIVKTIPKKRNRLAIVDSDSDSDAPTAKRNASTQKTKKSSNSSEDDESGSEDSEHRKPASKRRRIQAVDSGSESDTSPVNGKSHKENSKNKSTFEESLKGLKLYSSGKSNGDDNKENIEEKGYVIPKTKNVTSSQGSDVSATTEGKNWLHNRLDFLKPERIRDIKKNRRDHPDYDEKTLYVPEEFLSKQTPAMRQWWMLKSKHFDSVLFFKVGKFYELYHMDAVIGVNYLGFSYMRGEFAHSGFPESAYGRMASSLVEQGFKVARVEQTETPEMMAERCKTTRVSGKFDKVVKREICQVTTKATCVYGAQLSEAKQALPCYMLAIAEKQISNGSRFGVCFIDTSIGIFNIGEFNDDRHCSRLLTLLAEHSTGLILTERGRMQKSTNELLKKTLANVLKDALTPNSQFYNAQNTLDVLVKGCYFRDKNDDFHWPSVLQEFIQDGSPKQEYELALKSFGACIWYLKDSELDMHILPMKKFEIYHPVDTIMDKEITKRDYMVLDSMTIENLSLLGSTGTLQKTLDHCETSFGKRLLQRWICRPLCVQQRILERQQAVEELYYNDEMRQAARAVLKKLPDLERQVTKIHTFGNRFCALYHPDSRAILYEAKTYSKRKILDLLSTINGFEKASELVGIFSECKSGMLRKLTQHPPEGKFIDLSKTIQFFREAFDQKQAETEGKIIPQSGVDEDYDESEKAIADIQQELKDYLEEQQKFFGCKLSYFGTDKKRFQIEVPENKTYKVTTEYLLEGTKKGSKPAKRYTTPVTKRLLAEMIKAESKRNKIVQDLNRRIFEKFSDRRDEWEQCIQCLMVLDVICSFAEYARAGSRSICFPKILPFQDEPFVNIEDGVHPCTLLEDFVPNSTKLGIEDTASIMLLTGPNMGGKSTLMRQVALIIVMAQMGCPVPAVNCEISLVDRIFTRLGAYDDILQGQSTFLVELSEASAILQHATRHSFVLLDELGRGTSTHDGNAIATAYVCKLTEIQCRSMFSTHYHTLVESFSGRNDIQLAHMACMSDTDEEKEDDPLQSVTLLYQLREGYCPKSFGFNAARLAGVPKSIIERAHVVASNLEAIAKTRRLVSDLLTNDNIANIRNLFGSLHLH
ncbi:hypothetical protein ILUMI_23880 [Ignelater luminosus]|uniref:DNA mismatch repair protein n=1 Tax=Ignelater luminosus TaxID=2038154 RepID=A0A8K0FWS1_IGNLU|nr:hypothetical protein ILUMI_23880 [Ignelater luminosus]